MSKFLFFDTETTGNTPDDFLCQIAYKNGDEIFCELYKPSVPIPPEASAVHHITNKMIADKPAFRESGDYSKLKELFENPEIISVAHNAKFDLNMLKKEDIEPKNVICTLRLARYLDKENKIPRYNLQFLRYYLDMDIDAQAHDALGDVKVLEALFVRLKNKVVAECGGDEEKALEEMLAISARPSLMNIIPFGKYVGKTVEWIVGYDCNYLEWLLAEKTKNPVDEEDWIYTLKHYLKK
ncbi:MAG: exonuclease domain-containing protein [Candidatus Paceibacterota bacterium]|jgi:exodeoxyribonuclease X